MSAPRPETTRIAHQPALDGLRGLAVIGVLCFHGGHLTGGYLGVDAFFVLSGFLITSLLLAEATARSTVSLRRFWERRARRLLPAAVCVVLAVAAYAAFFADRADLSGIRGDSFATLAYVANWHAIWTSTDYFAMFASPSPLQHTWSLAIEEQFYLVWPLVVLLLVRRRPAPEAARRVLRLSTVGAAASVLIAQLRYAPTDTIVRSSTGVIGRFVHVVVLGRGPSRVYYGTDTRAASILIGSALAAWLALHPFRSEPADGTPRLRGRRGVLECIAALTMIGLGVAWTRLDGASPVLYRGGLLLAAIGVVVVIAAAVHPQRGPVHRVLAWRPLCTVGLVSYGLYLWHWPLFVLLSPDRTHLDGWPLFALRLGVTALVAAASYRWLEAPIRHGAGRAETFKVLVPVTAVVVVLAVVGATIVPDGTSVAAVRSGGLMIAGDSVAESLVPGFTQHSMYAVDAAVPGCRLMPGKIRGSKSSINSCDWRWLWTSAIRAHRPAAVVLLAGTWDLLDTKLPGSDHWVGPGTRAWDDEWRRQLGDAITTLSGRGAKVLVATIPCYGAGGAVAAPRHSMYDIDRVQHANALLRSTVAQYPDRAVVADLFQHVCPSGHFQASLGNIPRQRRDGVHFSDAGSAAVAAWLAPQVLRVAPTTNLGDHRHEVVVYGDDFMAEITPHLQQVTMNDERMLVHVHSVPLAGLCDISRAVRADADVPHASAVFVEFQGSGLTPCAGAHGAFGSPTHLAALRHELVDLAHATARPDRPLVITAPPPSPTVAGRALQRAVHSIAVEVAKQIPGVIVDDAAAEGVGGTTWTSSLPCLPADRRHPECSGGSAPVRGPDRTTLCTTSYSSLVALMAGCTSFSNGVNRYTAGLVTTIAVHG